jgi:hypothetical protein
MDRVKNIEDSSKLRGLDIYNGVKDLVEEGRD